MAGQRETVPLLPLPRLLRQEEFREVTGTQTEEYSEPPHPEVSRADDDISCPPSPAPSSPGEEPGRQEDDEPDSSQDLSEDSSEDCSDDLLDELDLQRWRAIQLCTLGPPHSCEEYWDTITDEEFNLYILWWDQSMDQLPAGERSRRPDIEKDENKQYPSSFNCPLLREIRRLRD